MEKRITELNTILSQPENASNMELVTEYTSIQRALDAENERWMELNEKMEELWTLNIELWTLNFEVWTLNYQLVNYQLVNS